MYFLEMSLCLHDMPKDCPRMSEKPQLGARAPWHCWSSPLKSMQSESRLSNTCANGELLRQPNVGVVL
jgi:hypothetical protein